MILRKPIFGLLTLSALLAGFLPLWSLAQQPKSTAKATSAAGAAEDISGMYSFLHEGEFLQINLEKDAVTGYISRLGDQESDLGVYLDQFFAKAAISGHDVSFTTRPIHGVWFEFSGHYDRGKAKTKGEDGYFILRGVLKEFVSTTDKNATSRSRDVEFKLMAQPPDDAEQPAAKSGRAKD